MTKLSSSASLSLHSHWGIVVVAGERQVNQADEAFRSAYAEHGAFVLALARRAVGGGHAAEDICQEVFSKYLYVASSLTITVSLKAWLARTTLNTAANWRRSEKRMKRGFEAVASRSVEESAASASHDAETRFRAEEVRRVLQGMKPRDREMLLLYSIGLTYREIAESVDVKVTSVGTLLARAEARFKARYEGEVRG